MLPAAELPRARIRVPRAKEREALLGDREISVAKVLVVLPELVEIAPLLSLVDQRLGHHLDLVRRLHDARLEALAVFRLAPRRALRLGEDARRDVVLELLERGVHSLGLLRHRDVARLRLRRVVHERHAERLLAVDRDPVLAERVDEEHHGQRHAVAVIGDRLARADPAEQPAGARQIREGVERDEGVDDPACALAHGSKR